jgi:hypothetical protein
MLTHVFPTTAKELEICESSWKCTITKSDQPKARENLDKAIKILKEYSADGWVERYEKELAALS